MTDTTASAPSAYDAWSKANYISAVPDFKGAPDIMFHAAAGWGYPDPAWQREHLGWEPDRNALPVAGHPVRLSHWPFWVPKAEIKREARRLRVRRVMRYAIYCALYPLVFTLLIVVLLWLLFLPAGIIALILGAPVALAGSIALFIAMSLILATMDFAYLTALRRGVRGTGLFYWTFAPALALDLVVTFGLSLLTYFIINLAADGHALAVFSAAAAMCSLLGTIPLLAIYAIRELRLRES